LIRKPFGTVWARICQLEGEEFETITHLPFTYSLESGTTLWIHREGRKINQRLGRSNFEQVYRYIQSGLVTKPVQINITAIKEGESQVRGPYYVWAILHDERVDC